MSTRQPPVADAVAGIGYDCLLCGHRAHAYTADDGQTVEVWDLCRDCNAAFHFLVVGLELLQALPATPAADQIPGQLELEAPCTSCGAPQGDGGTGPGGPLCAACSRRWGL